MNTQANLCGTLKHPSAFLPIAMSLLAVAAVLTHIALAGTHPSRMRYRRARLAITDGRTAADHTVFRDQVVTAGTTLRAGDSRAARSRGSNGTCASLPIALVNKGLATRCGELRKLSESLILRIVRQIVLMKSTNKGTKPICTN